MFINVCVLTINLLLVSGTYSLDENGDIEQPVTELVSSIVEKYQRDMQNIISRLENKITEQDKQIQFLLNRDKKREDAIKVLLKKLNDKEDKRTNEKDGSNNKTKRAANSVKTRQIIQDTETISFMAYMDHNIDHMGVGHTIKANQVLLNDGAAYNNTTGVFTVPVSGVYMFNYHFNSHFRKTLIGLLVDGKNIVDAIAVPKDSTQEMMGGNTAVIQVRAGQSVWLEEIIVNDGEIYTTPAARYATFSGVLLY